MFEPSKINTYALKKDKYISISLELSPAKSKASKPKPQAVVKTQEVSQDIDVNDLFSDVWTKKITKTKPKAKNNRRIDAIQKKIDTTEQNQVESLTQKFQDLEEVKTDKDNASASTASEVNEYLAKIQAIVYRHFHVPKNSQGYSVKAVIELNALGKVTDFRILSYSAHDALNLEVDKIKSRLQKVIFPMSPNKKSSRTIVILKSKE